MTEENRIDTDTLEKTVRIDREPGDLIVGLDIGTTKICCIVGEIFDDRVEVIGVGNASSIGLKKGIVVNIESTVQSIREAVAQAEKAAGCNLRAVYVGIAGSHIKGFNSPGILALNGREIKQVDIDDVIEAAKAVKISENQQILHVLPQEYMVDDNTGIQNPLGMAGVRLVTNVHIVTADIGAVHNLYTCCNKAGLEVEEMVLEPIASSHAVLSADEMELGVALLDIGGGTTDLAVFFDGTIRHTFELGLGGHNLTNDLSVGLRTPLHEAESLKEDYGGANASIIKPNYVVDVPTVGDRESRKVTQKVVVEILEARIREILEIINQELINSGQKNKINGGIVITGGTSLLANLEELAEEIFGLPVRIGYPSKVGGCLEEFFTPRCATGVGLVVYGSRHRQDQKNNHGTFAGRFLGWLKNIV